MIRVTICHTDGEVIATYDLDAAHWEAAKAATFHTTDDDLDQFWMDIKAAFAQADRRSMGDEEFARHQLMRARATGVPMFIEAAEAQLARIQSTPTTSHGR